MRIDGTKIAKQILEELSKRTENLKKKRIIPHLVIFLVGNDPASEVYVRHKENKAKTIGAKTTIIRLPSSADEEKLLNAISQLNNDSTVQGIIVQRPLPAQINEKKIDLAVDPEKDIDSFHPDSPYTMPLAAAVLRILEEAYCKQENKLKSQRIVVIGKGKTGGGPVIQMLRKINITPVVIDSKTLDPKEITKNADILISTVGKPNIVKKDMIKKGVILISVGLHKGDDGKLHGDYEEEEINNIASFYTPTPGGVGPVNVAMLLENLIQAAENINKLD